jgi:hypothetical protein
VVNKVAHNNLAVGDTVRVRSHALYAEIRKITKQGDTKSVVVHWSPELYQVSRVIPAHEYTAARYKLTLDGEDVLTEYRMNRPNEERGRRVFLRRDLMLVDDNANEGFNITQAQAKKLNRIFDVNCRNLLPLLLNLPPCRLLNLWLLWHIPWLHRLLRLWFHLLLLCSQRLRPTIRVCNASDKSDKF